MHQRRLPIRECPPLLSAMRFEFGGHVEKKP
jgi:hypothetical protein